MTEIKQMQGINDLGQKYIIYYSNGDDPDALLDAVEKIQPHIVKDRYFIPAMVREWNDEKDAWITVEKLI